MSHLDLELLYCFCCESVFLFVYSFLFLLIFIFHRVDSIYCFIIFSPSIVYLSTNPQLFHGWVQKFHNNYYFRNHWYYPWVFICLRSKVRNNWYLWMGTSLVYLLFGWWGLKVCCCSSYLSFVCRCFWSPYIIRWIYNSELCLLVNWLLLEFNDFLSTLYTSLFKFSRTILCIIWNYFLKSAAYYAPKSPIFLLNHFSLDFGNDELSA